MEIQSCTVGNPNTEQSATPWVELELNSLSTSEKAIEYENTVELPRIHLPYLYGCYAFGITLEKVDLDLRGAHHDIRSSRPLRLNSSGADQLLRRSVFDLSCLRELSSKG